MATAVEMPAAVQPTGARMRRSWWIALALLLWAAVPVLYLLIRARPNHQTLSGADSVLAVDPLQYLSWIRSSGEHLLAGNGFGFGRLDHDYLQPMFAISGGLWRLGLGVGLAYLVWLPVAVAVLFTGFRSYCRRMLPGGSGHLWALALALFFVSPFQPLVGLLGRSWTGLGVAAGELAPTGSLFGYFPAAIATGLVPVCLLGCERIITDGDRRRLVAGTALAGGLAAWLHPWQGEVIVLVMVGLAVAGRFASPYRRLLLPMAATVAPLVYYGALDRLDSAWRLGQSQSAQTTPSLLVVALVLLPLLPFAAYGVRRWPDGVARRTLLLWPLATLVILTFSPGYAAHALEGLTLPVAVAAVAGWQRLARRGLWPVAATIVLVCTLPGLLDDLRVFRDVAHADPQAMLLWPDERAALSSIEQSRPGGVLASARLATAVPAYTGDGTWFGHPGWTPDYSGRYRQAGLLLSGRYDAAATQSAARSIGARYWLADCERANLRPLLQPLILSERKFGCVDLYTLAVPSQGAGT